MVRDGRGIGVLLGISDTTTTDLMAVGSEEEQGLRLVGDGQGTKVCRKPQRDTMMNLHCCFNGKRGPAHGRGVET